MRGNGDEKEMKKEMEMRGNGDEREMEMRRKWR